jgi:hypothetical protein
VLAADVGQEQARNRAVVDDQYIRIAIGINLTEGRPPADQANPEPGPRVERVGLLGVVGDEQILVSIPSKFPASTPMPASAPHPV